MDLIIALIELAIALVGLLTAFAGLLTAVVVFLTEASRHREKAADADTPAAHKK